MKPGSAEPQLGTEAAEVAEATELVLGAPGGFHPVLRSTLDHRIEEQRLAADAVRRIAQRNGVSPTLAPSGRLLAMRHLPRRLGRLAEARRSAG